MAQPEVGDEEVIQTIPRACLFHFDRTAREWKERAVGEIKFLKDKQTNKVRLLMRQDRTKAICADHIIPDASEVLALKPVGTSDSSWTYWAFDRTTPGTDRVDRDLALRFPTLDIAQQFATAFKSAQIENENASTRAAVAIGNPYPNPLTDEQNTFITRLRTRNIPEFMIDSLLKLMSAGKDQDAVEHTLADWEEMNAAPLIEDYTSQADVS